jgi:7-carboxy-7-deazaguanine synthase
MRICENIFASLQGEGPDAGLPASFIRLQGCNLACTWCDTKYSWGKEAREMSVDSILSELLAVSKSDFVIITGGEPLLQYLELSQLVDRLLKMHFRIAIQTNGTMPTPVWWKGVCWDIDYKCPSSGVKKPFYTDWALTGSSNRIKFVVADEQDLIFVEKRLPGLYSTSETPTIVVSPMIPVTSTDTYINPVDRDRLTFNWNQKVWAFCVAYRLRYSLQLHKIVFGNKKGV